MNDYLMHCSDKYRYCQTCYLSAYQLMASYFFVPLNLSVSNVECVKLLLSSGADHNRRDKHGR